METELLPGNLVRLKRMLHYHDSNRPSGVSQRGEVGILLTVVLYDDWSVSILDEHGQVRTYYFLAEDHLRISFELLSARTEHLNE